MKKRILSILLLCCMVLTLLPTAAFAEGSTEELPVCTCETACMAESMNDDCSVCGAEGASAENCAKYADSVNGEGSGTGTSRQALTNVAITFPTPEAGKPVGDGSAVSANADSGLTLYLFGPALWKQGEEPDKLDENAAYAEGNTYLLNFTFYTQKPITDETVLTYNGKPITRYADYQALTEALDAYDGKQDAYLGCVLFSAEGTGDPAMEDLKDLYLLSLYAFVRVPEAQIPEDTVDEQFSLAHGGRYYFDLSAMNIPGTVNDALPDNTLHYVPFTYAGTVNAYKLMSEMETTEEYAERNKYPHSLFVADYVVTHTVSWNDLDTASLIFGKDYVAGGVDYTLRAPSCGSGFTGSGDSECGTPQSNEWDAVLDKNSGYIQNWNKMYSWGQDTSSYELWSRALRGYDSARYWIHYYASTSGPVVGFRPVLEVLNADTLGSGRLKVVTLDLGGGTLGGSSDAIHIIVKNGSKFTAPASGGLTRPAGDTGSYFMWLDSNGNSYAPGASVPADVTELTVQWTAPTYAVTLHTNDGTINNGNVSGYTYGVGATLPTADDMTYTGHTFKGWYDNESLTGSPVTAIGDTETGNKEYWAKWEINQYTIIYDLAGGTVEGNPDTYTIKTGAFTLRNPTKSGYTFTGWSGTGLDGENNMTVTIPTGSTGNRTYTAHWRYNGGGGSSSSPSYPVSVPDKTDHGSVTVSPKNASAGSTVTITVKPDSGYVLETISVTDKNGNDLKLTDKGNGKYTFTMPASKVEIKVTFMEDNSVLNFFYDVPNDAYYYEAVKWAAENGITGGIGSSLFAPNQPCTRAQIVTFLWRAAGSPVVNYLMLFTDVDEGAYYAEAVRWAASTGIVTGLTETTFGTDSVCTRAQAAAMIYRCAQAQGKGFTGAWMLHLPFTDVPEWAYESVAWCYMNSVTTGVSETSFAPGNDCTRAQIVTFLWRAFGK